MEVSTVQTNDLFPKINDGETFQEIDLHSSEKHPESAARVILLKKRKTPEKDALLAVKLDPAVLEAQLTLMKEVKEDEDTSAQDSPAPVAEITEIESKDARSYPSFEEVVLTQQAALLGLTPQQMMLLMVFVDTLRRQRQPSQRQMECAFCKKNGSPVGWYTSHALRDRRRALCPVLRALRCPRCGVTGDRAHTLRYCPENLFSDSWSCP